MNASPFTPSYPRSKARQRIDLNKLPLYQIANPDTFTEFHWTHSHITEWEVIDLIHRARLNMRLGDTYVEPDLYPTELRNFHRL